MLIHKVKKSIILNNKYITFVGVNLNVMIKEGWMIVVNPKAGSGKGLIDWPIISNTLNRKGIDFTCVFTEHKYHAVELTVKAIKDGYRKLVAIGGDGTLHEVVNGIFIQDLVDSKDITLAVIPAGNGNDWVRMYGTSKSYNLAIEAMVESNTILQDVAKIEFYDSNVRHYRYMANGSGVGFDAAVAIKYNKLKENGRSGNWLYLYSLVKIFLTYKSKKFKIVVDGELFSNEPLLSASVGICKFSGGGMQQLPIAKIDDGLMDITVIKRMNKLRIIKDLKSLFNGKIHQNSKVIHTQCKSIEIESFPQSRIEVDGEPLGYSPFKYTIVESAIKVVVGKEFNKDLHSL